MTALLFAVSKFLIGLYLGRSSLGSAYGPAGALVLILAWVYYSSLVFLFGAEFTKVYAHRYGSRATSAAAPPLPQLRDHTPPVMMPQGVRSVSSPGYGRYVIAGLSFVFGMVIGARRRARYS
jgi:virulence factor BrkB